MHSADASFEALLPHAIKPPGFRLPNATRLGRVILQVADLDRSIRYYRDVIGLRVLTQSRARAVMGAHDDSHALIELVELAGATPAPAMRRLGLYHVAILLPDRPALGRFLSHVADTDERVGMSDHLVSEALYLTDPDGLGLEVYADRPRATWRSSNGQLAMASDPLDVRDLMSASGGEPWTGAPAGTAIGHVHLHVGDLTAGSSFYHDGIGFDKTVWQYPGALFLSAGGYHHHVGTNIWARNAESARHDEARLLEWEIVLPSAHDTEALASNLEAHGISVSRERDGGSITVSDPWGTRVRVSAGHARA